MLARRVQADAKCGEDLSPAEGEGLMFRKRLRARAVLAGAATATAALLVAGCSSGRSGSEVNGVPNVSIGPLEKTTLNVAAVPAMDSAGFFVALHEGLFAAEGLKIIEAAAQHHDPLQIIAEGSVMSQGASPRTARRPCAPATTCWCSPTRRTPRPWQGCSVKLSGSSCPANQCGRGDSNPHGVSTNRT
jgi:hypothetical protein